MKTQKTEEEIKVNFKNDITNPLVSICCVTYNHCEYISQTLEGFLMQKTNFTFEIILGEDDKWIDAELKKFNKLIKNYIV